MNTHAEEIPGPAEGLKFTNHWKIFNDSQPEYER